MVLLHAFSFLEVKNCYIQYKSSSYHVSILLSDALFYFFDLGISFKYFVNPFLSKVQIKGGDIFVATLFPFNKRLWITMYFIIHSIIGTKELLLLLERIFLTLKMYLLFFSFWQIKFIVIACKSVFFMETADPISTNLLLSWLLLVGLDFHFKLKQTNIHKTLNYGLLCFLPSLKQNPALQLRNKVIYLKQTTLHNWLQEKSNWCKKEEGIDRGRRIKRGMEVGGYNKGRVNESQRCTLILEIGHLHYMMWVT